MMKTVGPRLLDGVLGGDDHEGQPDVVGRAVDRDGALLHHLEQSRLGLRAGPVDLVGEHDVGEDGATVELEVAAALVEDAHTRDVARQQVGGELDAVVRSVDALRDGTRERGLACAGKVLEQQVSLAEQRREAQPDDEGLAEQHRLHIGHEPGEVVGEPAGLLGCHGHSVASRTVVRCTGTRRRADR
jgi:hypothetical protein